MKSTLMIVQHISLNAAVKFADPSASFSKVCSFLMIKSLLLAAIQFLYLINSEVFIDYSIPEVEDTSFLFQFAISIKTEKKDSFSGYTTACDIHSLFNASISNSNYPDQNFFKAIYLGTPFHFTSPPQIDLAALPEPLLANQETSSLVKILPNSPFKAATKHANPEAEDAKPEAVGKEFQDTILKKYFSHQLTYLYFLSFAKCLTLPKICSTRFVIGLCQPFKTKVSLDY